jgi:4-hydroxyphenylpyruvate dioxygenase
MISQLHSKPQPSNAPQANPMQTDGFEFVEYTSPHPEKLHQLLINLGFTAIAKHRSKNVILYRQGDINFILNQQPNSYASTHAQAHGPSACAMAFRVKDAAFAHQRALSLGAESIEVPIGAGELKIPAIKGIGDSVLFFVDHYQAETIYHHDFIPLPGVDQHPHGAGLTYIDHLTHNVFKGRMDHWAKFYEQIFNFREQRYFNITGQKTGLLSRAMISPCGKIRIPINESTDDKSQIAEYLEEYKGEGIQHIALGTDDICQSVEQLKVQGIPFMTVPDSYYQVVQERLPSHGQDMPRLHKNHILMDGEIEGDHKDLLLQIFTKTVIGPIFFEIIQRKGHQGFGEGNFSALFEAMERDQMERGVL